MSEPIIKIENLSHRYEDGSYGVGSEDIEGTFLVAWGAVGESVTENNTVPNLTGLMEATRESGTPMVISRHYYYPTDHGWQFEGTLEKLMHDIQMFDRTNALHVEGFEGSGADWMEEFKPFICDDKTIVCGAHKVCGPQNNDVVLQLQK